MVRLLFDRIGRESARKGHPIESTVLHCYDRIAAMAMWPDDTRVRFMKTTQATITLPAQEDAASVYLVIKPMLLRPRFMKETDLLLHVPLLFWLVNAVRPAKSVVLGMGQGVGYLAICQAIEEFSIQGRCAGIGFEGTPDVSGTSGQLDNYAIALYDGIADLRDHATPDEALRAIQPDSLDFLFVDLCECPGEAPDPAGWMERLAPGGCLTVHGLDETGETIRLLAGAMDGLPGHVLLFLNFGAGLAVILKDGPATEAMRHFAVTSGNGDHYTTDSPLLRRLGQGLSAISRNSHAARQLADLHKEYLAGQERQAKTERDLAALTEAYEARNRRIWELQATNFDREAEHRNLQQHQRVLGESVAALKSALEMIQKERDSLSEALTEQLRQEKHSHYRETGILTKLLEQKNDAHQAQQAELQTLRKQVRLLSEYNESLLSSTSWRITAPIRKIKTTLTGK